MKLLPLLGISSSYAFSKTEGDYQLDDGNGVGIDGCLVCEYINVAANEDDAQDALADNASTIPCINANTVSLKIDI